MATSDIIQDNTIRNGSVVLQPSRCRPLTATVNERTYNTYPLAQPTATSIESKYTNKFDDVGYYVTPDLIDGNP